MLPSEYPPEDEFLQGFLLHHLIHTTIHLLQSQLQCFRTHQDQLLHHRGTLVVPSSRRVLSSSHFLLLTVHGKVAGLSVAELDPFRGAPVLPTVIRWMAGTALLPASVLLAVRRAQTHSGERSPHPGSGEPHP